MHNAVTMCLMCLCGVVFIVCLEAFKRSGCALSLLYNSLGR